MTSDIVVLLLGILSFIASVPKLLPLIGLALGANNLIKKDGKKDKAMSIVGTILCTLTLII